LKNITVSNLSSLPAAFDSSFYGMIIKPKAKGEQNINKTKNHLFMKMPKNAYLVLAVLFFLAFINSLFETERTHDLLFWEVNIWVYRFFRLAIAVLFMKSYLDIRNAEKGKED
jgi:hypothetical protein